MIERGCEIFRTSYIFSEHFSDTLSTFTLSSFPFYFFRSLSFYLSISVCVYVFLEGRKKQEKRCSTLKVENFLKRWKVGGKAWCKRVSANDALEDQFLFPFLKSQGWRERERTKITNEFMFNVAETIVFHPFPQEEEEEEEGERYLHVCITNIMNHHLVKTLKNENRKKRVTPFLSPHPPSFSLSSNSLSLSFHGEVMRMTSPPFPRFGISVPDLIVWLQF